MSKTVLSNPQEIVVHTSGHGHAALQVIDVGKAKGELPEITSPRDFPVSPHFAAGLHAILADSTAEHAVAYWADELGAKSARISRAYGNPTGFVYRGPEKQDDIIRTAASTLTGGSAGTIVQPRLGSNVAWFETMFGFSDYAEDHRLQESKAKFLEHRKKFTYDANTGTLTSSVNGGEWHAGTFTTPSLAELRKQNGAHSA